MYILTNIIYIGLNCIYILYDLLTFFYINYDEYYGI